jgi:hypothetical protein
VLQPDESSDAVDVCDRSFKMAVKSQFKMAVLRPFEESLRDGTMGVPADGQLPI